MTVATVPRTLADLRATWRPARARTLVAAAALLRAVEEEAGLNTGAQAIGTSWVTAYGAPAVSDALAREVEYQATALGVDGLGILPERVFYDPHEPASARWWMRDDVLAKLQKIAEGKR